MKQTMRALEDQYAAFMRLSDEALLGQQIAELEAESGAEDFWLDSGVASQKLQQLNDLKASLSRIAHRSHAMSTGAPTPYALSSGRAVAGANSVKIRRTLVRS